MTKASIRMRLSAKFTLIVLIFILVVVLFAIILNIPVTTRQGINFKVTTKKIPLYIKLSGLIYRDYQYKEIIKDIIKKDINDEEKILRIFAWTHENTRPVPEGFPIVDDHILNIIIRGYGTSDQSADVFCNLCEYAGFSAKWAFVRVPDLRNSIVLSFVNLNNKWRVFDTYYGNYFLNKNEEIASVEDIINDFSLIEQAKNKPMINGVEYSHFFKGLQSLTEKNMWKRARAQMPLSRMKYEIKKIFFNLR